MSDSEIMTELKRLAEACPEDRCDIWVCMGPGAKLSFVAYVQNRDKLPSICSHGDSPKAVVDEVLPQVIGQRGNVHNVKAKQAAIDKLKAEVAKLESEIDPLLGAMVKASEVVP